MKNKIIVPTGYMGSGSSAITDLLGEMEGIDVSRGTFEFVFLHCPNGLFDLEDKLLIGNNAVRSDEAIHSFYYTMKQLYDKKYWWVGHYKDNVGEDFLKITDEFIKKITDFETPYYWYYQENVTYKMLPQLILNKILAKIPGGKKHIKKALRYSPMLLSFINPDEFYKCSKEYLYKVLERMGKDKKHIVLDQLLLPFNLFRIENYFEDDLEVFVVERDPRDVFISNKYYWSKNNELVPYPTDVKKYCEYYRKLRDMETKVENPHVHRIKFEDMVYKYDETVAKILEILSLDEAMHKGKKTLFVPEISIKNTQLFNMNSRYKDESSYIEACLREYLYEFPYLLDEKDRQVF